jgi:hypothetical protein
VLSAEADKAGSLVGLSPQTIDTAKMWLGNTVPALMGLANPLAAPAMLAMRFGPSADDIKQSIEAAAGAPLPTHTPQTAAGRYTQTIAEMLPAVFAGEGGILSRLARNVVLPAIASETAGHAVAGTAAEAYARIGGAMLGGGLAASVMRGSSAAEAAAANVEGRPVATRAAPPRSPTAPAEPPYVDTATAPLVPIGPLDWDRALAAARLRGDIDWDALSARARQFHGALDPKAQTRRTTAVLSTDGPTIIGGSGDDLVEKQLRLLRDGEVYAEYPGAISPDRRMAIFPP